MVCHMQRIKKWRPWIIEQVGEKLGVTRTWYPLSLCWVGPTPSHTSQGCIEGDSSDTHSSGAQTNTFPRGTTKSQAPDACKWLTHVSSHGINAAQLKGMVGQRGDVLRSQEDSLKGPRILQMSTRSPGSGEVQVLRLWSVFPVLSFAFSCKQGEQVDCLYTFAVWRMFSKESGQDRNSCWVRMLLQCFCNPVLRKIVVVEMERGIDRI